MTFNQIIPEFANKFGLEVTSDYGMSVLNRLKKPYELYPALFTNKRVLDIGAFTGEHSFILSKLGNIVTSLEINPAVTKQLQNNLNPENITVKTKYQDLEGTAFDTVFVSAVINYQADPIAWYQNLLNTLDFKYLVLVYHDGYTSSIKADNIRCYSPDVLGYTDVLVNKQDLLEASKAFKILEKNYTWIEPMQVSGNQLIKSLLIIERI